MNQTDRKILDREQVRRVDELAVQKLGMPSIILMENAGRNAAEWIAGSYAEFGRAAVFCGTGNNGGDGFVIARHLHNRGWTVRAHVVGQRNAFSPDAGTNHRIAELMGIPIEFLNSVEECRRAAGTIDSKTVVIDALLGTGFSGSVREPMAALVQAINRASAAGVVAVDVPSGLDCDSGAVGNVAIIADATVTFVARKQGFDAGFGTRHTGRIVVVDIGAPLSLIEEVC